MFSKGSRDDHTPGTASPTSTTQTPPPPSAGFNASSPAPAAVQRPAAPSAQGGVSVISSDLKVIGNLVCQGAIQVDGRVEGDIQTKQLTIGEQATISGTVQADTIRVAGTVEGELSAQTIVLLKTARVTGDIVHKDLAIETGAYLEGNVRRAENPGASNLSSGYGNSSSRSTSNSSASSASSYGGSSNYGGSSDS